MEEEMARIPLKPVHILSARSRQCLLFLLFILFVLNPASLVWAGESGCSQPEPQDNVQKPTAAADDGLRAFVDPDTGELISEPASSRSQSAGAEPSPPSPELTEQVLADGTIMLDLREQPVTELRAEIVDGQLVTCHRQATETDRTQTEPSAGVERGKEP